MTDIPYLGHPLAEIAIVGFIALLVYARYQIRQKLLSKIKRDNFDRTQRDYEWAKLEYDNENYFDAAILAAQAAGRTEYHECFNLLGHACEALLRPHAAARAFDAALWKGGDNDAAAFYAYRSALLYIRDSNWDLVYQRAVSGIFRLERAPKGRFLDGVDLLCELRSMKILAAFHNEAGTDSLDDVQDDVEWLDAHAQNDRQRAVVQLAREWTGAIVPEIHQITKRIWVEFKIE